MLFTVIKRVIAGYIGNKDPVRQAQNFKLENVKIQVQIDEALIGSKIHSRN